MWEQNDVGGADRHRRWSATPRRNGPLFRQFGTAAQVSATDTLLYALAGREHDRRRTRRGCSRTWRRSWPATPTRPPAPARPRRRRRRPSRPRPPSTASRSSCRRPTGSASLGDRTLNFRLTARDGKLGGGGVGSAATKLTLAPFAGPFRVTSRAVPQIVYGSAPQTVTWDVAGTDVAPINVANVKISLSTDGGQTFRTVLAASTPNDGSQHGRRRTSRPTKARIKVEAIGNVFFDVSHADVAIVAPPTTPVGGTVPATLSLTLGAPAAFGAFTPGVTKDYDAVHDGDRDLDRGRRDAERRRPEQQRARAPRQRRVRASVGAAGQGRTPARSRSSAARR